MTETESTHVTADQIAEMFDCSRTKVHELRRLSHFPRRTHRNVNKEFWLRSAVEEWRATHPWVKLDGRRNKEVEKIAQAKYEAAQALAAQVKEAPKPPQAEPGPLFAYNKPDRLRWVTTCDRCDLQHEADLSGLPADWSFIHVTHPTHARAYTLCTVCTPFIVDQLQG